MNPDKVIRENVIHLTDHPNIGKAMEKKLLAIGISRPGQLTGRSALLLHGKTLMMSMR